MGSRTEAALLLWLSACGAATQAPDDPPDDPVVDTADPCGGLDWATAGAPVILTWCAPCHGSGVAPGTRQGAPREVVLDDEATTRALAARLLARATGPSPTMPPVGGPTEAERERLAAWLRCP